MNKMSSPLVSVLIPAYNHERYIAEAINSIINQTYQNIELIILDDGSKDSTWSVIKDLETKCKNRFKNINFQTQKNQGVCKTLNSLIKRANGEYIFIIASDDIAKPEAISELVKHIGTNILAVGNSDIIDTSSKICSWDNECKLVEYGKGYLSFWDFFQNYQPRLKTLKSFGSYESILEGNYIPNCYLIKKDAIKKIGGYTPKAPLEDWYLHLQLSKIGSYCFINKILSSYRWHDNNTIKQAEKIKQYELLTLQYEKYLLKKTKDIEHLKLFNKLAKPRLKILKKTQSKLNLKNSLRYFLWKKLNSRIKNSLNKQNTNIWNSLSYKFYINLSKKLKKKNIISSYITSLRDYSTQ